MESCRKYLEGRLKLKMNTEKSKVTSIFAQKKFKFLGFCLGRTGSGTYMPRAELAAVHAPDTEPGRWSLCWDHTSQSWEMRRGVAAEAAFIRNCSTPGLAWEALADYCLEHSDELDELAHTGTAWAGYPDDWAAASDELMDELLGVLL